MTRSTNLLVLAALALVLPTACSSEPPVPLAEKAEKLEVEKPKSVGAVTFEIGGEASTLGFEMNAPFEKIRGRVPASAVSGELNVDFEDITRSNGLVHVSLADLELFQRKAEKEGGDFGEETKSDLQNEHARNWLEIGADAPEEDRTKNALVEYSIKTVKSASTANVAAMSGAERKVTLTVEGEFLLHQRKAPKSAEVEVVFTFEGDKPTKMAVKTVKPLAIGLDEYDVRPREAFGKLAAKTLDLLSDKVAKEADVTIELTAAARAANQPASGDVAKPAAAPVDKGGY